MNNYDIIFLTNIPAFYKISLYNEIAKSRRILCIFLRRSESDRNSDFYNENMKFDCKYLSDIALYKRISFLFKLVFKKRYSNLILGGWDNIYSWILAFISPYKKNSVVVESSYHESVASGWKGMLKKIFLFRVSKVFVPGQSNKVLLEKLNFKGKCIITHGVGLYKLIDQPEYKHVNLVRRFLYVGRLVRVKNLEFLINAFKKRPNLQLSIVGYGEMDAYLKSIAPDNVDFIGEVNNNDLAKVYQSHDVFILPSISETWGLVVEEAINNGLPVIVSDKVGCASDFVSVNKLGVIFTNNEEKSLLESIDYICDIDNCNKIRKTISERNPKAVELLQIKSYLDI